MRKISTKNIASLIVVAATAASIFSVIGCKVSQKISEKTGNQLWSEHCSGCHNSPPRSTFSNEQWETIGLHMQTRALITDAERDKIVEFLKQ